jgi:hypothetical protein
MAVSAGSLDRSPACASEPEVRLVADVRECASVAVNPYRRCDIRCTYCITGAQGRSEPKFDDRALIAQLRRELAAFPADAAITLGGITDAYPSVEADLGQSRLVLAELERMRRRVAVITKGTTVVRDLDLLESPRCSVTFSMSSVDPQVLAAVEPGAAPVAERLAAVREVREAGVEVWISATPWIPALSDAATMIDAVRTQVGPVPILIGPLNVRAWPVARTRTGRRFTQAEVNEAFLDERARVGEQHGVVWLRPLPLTGGHTLDNPLESCQIDDRTVPVAAPLRRDRVTA